MARRRMFSLDVVDTDRFLDMPSSTQALYFHLGMRADDDGLPYPTATGENLLMRTARATRLAPTR